MGNRLILLDALRVDDLVVRILELDEVHALGKFGDVVGLLFDEVKSFYLTAYHIDDVDLGNAVAVADLEGGGNRVWENAEVFGGGLGREAQAEGEKKEKE